ncbi:hypothetical protein Fmac_017217 [Flemingia macrophylla]|uniref:BAG domain-containing protein n=1 Tax=Flemingia macrophylla TaxID=520843 RepID=A0ABD1M1G6_9FABA
MMQMKNTPMHRARWGMTPPGYNNYRAPSKVVSIPVHFVSSESTRSSSAVMIQKVVRGFLVRNTMRKISAMRVALDRIEREIDVEVVRREQRERLRVVETIMNLLLKLDSVRVLQYSGLRECRKSLIKKAIALQEMVDQIGVVESEKEGECVGEGNCLKDEEGEKNEEVDKENDREEEEGICMEEESIGSATCLDEEKEEVECEEGEEIGAIVGENYLVNDEEGDCEEGEEIEAMVGENCLEKNEEGGRYEGKDKRELLLENMAEENERMMEIMAQLLQRNEMQTRLLTSLTRRVEQLERAYACEKLKKKNKRNAGAKNRKIDRRNSLIGF